MAESIGSSAAETGDIDRLIEDAWSVATSDPQRARTLTELALDRSQKANCERGRAYCMRNTAYVHLMSSDLELAQPLAESALAQLHALDETPGVASALDIKTLRSIGA